MTGIVVYLKGKHPAAGRRAGLVAASMTIRSATVGLIHTRVHYSISLNSTHEHMYRTHNIILYNSGTVSQSLSVTSSGEVGGHT